MKKLLLASILILSTQAKSFTCVSPNCVRFNSSNITVHFTNTSCAGSGLTHQTLRSFTQMAADDFWNAASTSSLKLSMGELLSIDVSAETSAGAVAQNHAPAGSILVSCSNNATVFPGGNQKAGEGAISCLGDICRGAVLIRTTDGIVSGLSSQDIITLMAHEMAHAFGLGHTEETNAVMYQSFGGALKTQTRLHQDDRDGVSYLYPNDKKLAGLMGSCSTIDLDSPNDGGNNSGFIFSWIVLVMSVLLVLTIKKNKAA